VSQSKKASGPPALAAATKAAASKAASGKAAAPPKPVAPKAIAVSLEAWDPQLAASLTALAVAPSAEAHRRVALEYRRLEVLDQAHAHLTRAIELDPRNASALDARARIWRDWGFPELGLADARDAVALVPESPEAANTLGTLLEATHHLSEARVWYQRALTLDTHATYALNNLCYSAIMLADDDAVSTCRRAVAASPGARVARNNLGLAYAASGNLAKAKELFDSHGNVAYAQYNMGIVYMGTRQYDKALAAFLAASQLNPQLAGATERAKQAGVFLAAEGHSGSN
jgi:tetratricopeptide (TPR) repeat protein